MAECRPPRVRVFIILENEGVGSGIGHFQPAGHRRLLAQVQPDRQVAGGEIGRVIPGCGTVLQVKHLRQNGEFRSHPGPRAGKAVAAAHRADLLHRPCQEFRVGTRDLRVEDRIHGPDRAVTLHLDISQGQHSAGEILRRGDGALHRIGVETHLSFGRALILLKQALADQPLAEELAHLRLQHAALAGQFAGGRGPLKPLVRGDAGQHRTLAGKGGTDVVAAQDDDLFQGVALVKAIRPRHPSLAFR